MNKNRIDKLIEEYHDCEERMSTVAMIFAKAIGYRYGFVELDNQYTNKPGTVVIKVDDLNDQDTYEVNSELFFEHSDIIKQVAEVLYKEKQRKIKEKQEREKKLAREREARDIIRRAEKWVEEREALGWETEDFKKELKLFLDNQ